MAAACILISMKRLSGTTAATAGSQLFVYAGLWFTVFNWGAAFVAARFLLYPASARLAALSPLLLATARICIASLFFAGPLGRALVKHQLTLRDLLLMFLLGQMAFSLYFWMQYTGVQQTGAGIASILVIGLIPPFTALLGPALSKERLTPSLGGALLLGFGGVVLMVLQQPFTIRLQAGFVLGVLCLLGNALSFSLYSHLTKRFLRVISPAVLTGGMMVSGALGLILLTLLDPAHNRWQDVALLNGTQWAALLFLAVVCSVLSYFAYNRALSKLAAARVTVYLYFEPVVAVLLGVTLLGEQFTWQMLLGTLAIAGSVLLVNKRTKAEQRT
jgi:drug/metabolite transporter (DMT)-like permease